MGDAGDRNGRELRDRVGDEATGDPDLVEGLEAGLPALGKVRKLPSPIADVVAAGKLVSPIPLEQRYLVGVHVKDVDRVRTARGETLPHRLEVEAANVYEIVDHERQARSFQAADVGAHGLSHAFFRVHVTDHVDAQGLGNRRAELFLRIFDLFCYGHRHKNGIDLVLALPAVQDPVEELVSIGAEHIGISGAKIAALLVHAMPQAGDGRTGAAVYRLVEPIYETTGRSGVERIGQRGGRSAQFAVQTTGHL